jgi:hypothetical protein
MARDCESEALELAEAILNNETNQNVLNIVQLLNECSDA